MNIERYAKLLQRMDDPSSHPSERETARNAVSSIESGNPGIRLAYLRHMAKREASANVRKRVRVVVGETPLQGAMRRAASWGMDYIFNQGEAVLVEAFDNVMQENPVGKKKEKKASSGTLDWSDGKLDKLLEEYVEVETAVVEGSDEEEGDLLEIKFTAPIGLFADRICERKGDALKFLLYLDGEEEE